VVFVDESAEKIATLDRRGGWCGSSNRLWWLQSECSVWALAVVMRRVDAEHVREVAAAEDEQPVEAFGGDGADEPFGVGVRLWPEWACG
jgi:hypothetical protein